MKATTGIAILVVALLAAMARGVAAQAGVQPAPAAPSPHPGAVAPELDCKNCHLRNHQGVIRMYLGTGGRGSQTIPSHMAEVRVECVACHVAPREEDAAKETGGQTFRAAEQACLGCHGEKYRGMLERWVVSVAKMREAVAPKVAGARAALAGAEPKAPNLGRARRLVEDAESNARFVAVGKGAHNVFYAANLLRLSTGWADEALALLGKPAIKTDDALVRGGYCSALCHEPGGVKFSDTVMFMKQKLPHRRHVAELGATCTTCHSAEVHKARSATPATCSSCHHSSQNDRCESCHAAQAAFYRGTVKTSLTEVEPNVMVNAVPCTGCHDFTRRHSRQAVGQKCVECHEAPYLALHGEWTTGFDQDAARVAATLKRAEAALASARRTWRQVPTAAELVTEARGALALVRRARGAHNPAVADALLEAARQKAEAALNQAGRR